VRNKRLWLTNSDKHDNLSNNKIMKLVYFQWDGLDVSTWLPWITTLWVV